MTTYVCPAGFGERLKSLVTGAVLEVGYPAGSLQQMLSGLPAGEVVLAAPPADWSQEQKDSFARSVEETWLTLQVSRQNVEAHWHRWAFNSLENHAVTMNSASVTSLKLSGPAVVCGNGPWLEEAMEAAPEGATIYSCWHAAHRLKEAPDFIGHCDVNPPSSADKPVIPKRGLIGTPTTSPDFWRSFIAGTMPYQFFGRDNEFNSYFADKTRNETQPAISGTVMDMLIQTALIAGHDVVYTAGLDLCFRSKEEAENYLPGRIIYGQDYDGNQVYTYEIYKLFARGLSQLPNLYPEAVIVPLSHKSLLIEGFKPRSQINA